MTSSAEKINVLVQDHIPSFYKEEGKDLLAFLEQYFAFLETEFSYTESVQTITSKALVSEARNLLQTSDIDDTDSTYINRFVNKYLFGIPDTLILSTDDVLERKRFLLKHIFDVYRSKGTERGYVLLFKILFDELISITYPSDNILKPSDGVYKIPNYVETSFATNIEQLEGRKIIGQTSDASALVEDVELYTIGGRKVYLLRVSSERGNFLFNEIIFDESKDLYDNFINAPRITGSLTSLTVTPASDGGGYSIGDELKIDDNNLGIGGKAIVSSTTNYDGLVEFTLSDGGSGYTITPEITIQAAGPIQTVNIDDQGAGLLTIPKYANGTIATSNLSNIFTIMNSFVDNPSGGPSSIGDRLEISAPSEDQMTDAFDLDNDGDVDIDDLTIMQSIVDGNTLLTANAESHVRFLNFVNQYYDLPDVNTNLRTHIFTYNSTAANGEEGSGFIGAFEGVFANGVLNDIFIANAGTRYVEGGTFAFANLILFNSNTYAGANVSQEYSLPQLSVTIPGSGASFEIGAISDLETIEVLTTTIDTELPVESPYQTIANTVIGAEQYFLPGDLDGNLTSNTIGNQLISANLEVGSIASIKNELPGSGYVESPAILIDENTISSLNLGDGSGGVKGNNAIVTGFASTQNNSILTVTVTDSGIGYRQGDSITLSPLTGNGSGNAAATVVLSNQGIAEGAYTEDRGLLLNTMKLQDSNFYQEYSIIVNSVRSKDKYEEIVKKIVHPAGVKLFSNVVIREILSSNTIIANSSISTG